MSVNKKDYRVVKVPYTYSTYVVQKRFLWFFWKTVKNRAGFNMEYTSRKGAQAYINFLK
jgi:hypothetical protein